MKKWIVCFLAAVMLLGLCACDEKQAATETASLNSDTNQPESTAAVTEGDLVDVYLVTEVKSDRFTMSFAYDENGRRTKESQQQGEQKIAYVYTYDENGKITETRAFANGQETGRQAYEYDQSGKLLQMTQYQNGEEAGQNVYSYDENGHVQQMIQYVKGEERYRVVCTCDEQGNVIAENTQQGGETYSSTQRSYEYYENGQLKRLTEETSVTSGFTSEPKLVYEYDMEGKLTAITGEYSSVVLEYDADGNLQRITSGAEGAQGEAMNFADLESTLTVQVVADQTQLTYTYTKLQLPEEQAKKLQADYSQTMSTVGYVIIRN